MIPTVVFPLPALPLLASEKVNRKALPPPDWSKHAVAALPASTAPHPPGSSQKTAAAPGAAAGSFPTDDPFLAFLRDLWSEVLGRPVEEITLDSDFFEMGGNSLLCGVCNGRVRGYLGAPGMSGLLLYQHTTLGSFAAAARAHAEVAALAADLGKLPLKGGDDSSDKEKSEQVVVITAAGSSSSSSCDNGSCPDSTSSIGAAAKTTANSKEATRGKESKEVCGGGRSQLARRAPSLAWATVAQAVGAAFGLSIQFLLALVPLLVFDVAFTLVGWPAITVLPAVDFALLLLHVVVAIGAKWLLVGRYKEGVEPIYGWFYVRHWLLNLLELVRVTGSPDGRVVGCVLPAVGDSRLGGGLRWGAICKVKGLACCSDRGQVAAGAWPVVGGYKECVRSICGWFYVKQWLINLLGLVRVTFGRVGRTCATLGRSFTPSAPNSKKSPGANLMKRCTLNPPRNASVYTLSLLKRTILLNRPAQPINMHLFLLCNSPFQPTLSPPSTGRPHVHPRSPP